MVLLRNKEIGRLAKPRALHLQLGYLRARESAEQTDTAASSCLLPMRAAECLDTQVLF